MSPQDVENVLGGPPSGRDYSLKLGRVLLPAEAWRDGDYWTDGRHVVAVAYRDDRLYLCCFDDVEHESIWRRIRCLFRW